MKVTNTFQSQPLYSYNTNYFETQNLSNMSVPITFSAAETGKKGTVSVKGTSEPWALAEAPSPKIKVQGVEKFAVMVVDVKKNILYTYKDGIPTCAYSIASGAPSTPTHTGIRVVTHTEDSPYKSAPASTVRRKHPSWFGPHAIIVRKVDPKTGETTQTGEFIHGNNNASSLGKHVSGGCMRMDNEVITKLYKQVKKGDYILIK